MLAIIYILIYNNNNNNTTAAASCSSRQQYLHHHYTPSCDHMSYQMVHECASLSAFIAHKIVTASRIAQNTTQTLISTQQIVTAIGKRGLSFLKLLRVRKQLIGTLRGQSLQGVVGQIYFVLQEVVTIAADIWALCIQGS